MDPIGLLGSSDLQLRLASSRTPFRIGLRMVMSYTMSIDKRHRRFVGYSMKKDSRPIGHKIV